MYKYLLTSAASLSAALLSLNAAQAATATGSFGVTLDLVESCTVTAPATTKIAFGQKPSLSANVDGTAFFKVTCSTGTDYDISLGDGQNTGRRMKGTGTANATSFVDYELYSDSARTVVWPSTASAGPTYPRTGKGTEETIQVYGRVPAQIMPDFGSYADTVTITVTY